MRCVPFAILSLVLFLAFYNVRSESRRPKANEVDIKAYKAKVERMFYHAYDSYLKYAYPYDELKPLTCKGHDTWGSYSLTLIDAMDTLAVMGNYSEFRRIANLVIDKGENAFDMDINVSVFETNIRIVGGLISAHLLMKRAGMELESAWPCSGPLLRMADSIARKLLPAFDTPTGMPYGTVNLRNGVPKGETPVTCTAGVGTFVVEFGTLSRLTGDPIFEKAAVRAIRSLWKFRSPLGLLGNHIDVKTGKWTALDSGIGGGVDSYFEYLVKGSILFNLPELTRLYREYEVSINKYLKKDDWYMWAQMNKGTVTLPMFTSLDAFWPNIQGMLGDIDPAMKTLHNFHMVWRQFGFTPEYYNIPKAEAHKGREAYPLRPELIESIMYLYRATKDPVLLEMGVDIVESIETQARTSCGYATVKNVQDHSLEDRMESFFLAETTKYLYLLFDPDNFIHNNGSHGEVIDTPSGSCIIEAGGYVFTTEAHPIDLAAVHCCSAKKLEEDKVLEDFHSNLDLLSLFNLVDDDDNDDDIGMTDWNKKKEKEKSGVGSSSGSGGGDGVAGDEETTTTADSTKDALETSSNDPHQARRDPGIQETSTDPPATKDGSSSSRAAEGSGGGGGGGGGGGVVPPKDVTVEIALPVGPSKMDAARELSGMTGKKEGIAPPVDIAEAEKSVVEIFMESLKLDAQGINVTDIVGKLLVEFKDTDFEKMAEKMAERLLSERDKREENKTEEKKGSQQSDIGVVIPEEDNVAKIDNREEDLKNFLLELKSAIVNETAKKKAEDKSISSSSREQEKSGDNSNDDDEFEDDEFAHYEDEDKKEEMVKSDSKNSQAEDSSTSGRNNEDKPSQVGEEDDNSKASAKDSLLSHHLETQIREDGNKPQSADGKTSDTNIESKRENILSLTKKVLRLFTSLSRLDSLRGVTGEDGGTEGSSDDVSPSLGNLYASLSKHSLKYLHDPASMHCPAQPFHSRLSVYGEFLVEDEG